MNNHLNVMLLIYGGILLFFKFITKYLVIILKKFLDLLRPCGDSNSFFNKHKHWISYESLKYKIQASF